MNWARARLRGRPTTSIKGDQRDGDAAGRWLGARPGKQHGAVDDKRQWSEWVEVTPLFCASPEARAWERHTVSSEGNGE
jgi:hypothetical protein